MKRKVKHFILICLLGGLLLTFWRPTTVSYAADTRIDNTTISVLGTNALSYSAKYDQHKMLDGITGSTQSNFWETKTAKTAYVTFDLGQTTDLSSMKVYARVLNSGTYGRCVKDYAVYVSNTAPVYSQTMGQVPSGLPDTATVEGTFAAFSANSKSHSVLFPEGTSGQYVTFYIKNIQDSQQTCIDIAEVEFYTKVNDVNDMAKALDLIPCPANDATRVTLPEVPDGYTVEIVASSNPDVVDLSGKITRSSDTNYAVRLTLKVTDTVTGASATTNPLLVPIYKTYTAPTMTRAEIDALHQDYEQKSYGVFVHYISEYNGKGTVYADGTRVQTIDEAAENFDVEAFAKNMYELGAEYVMFTVWHGDGRTLYPSVTNQRWRDERRSQDSISKKTYSDRDVIMELLDALDQYGIDLHLYTHPHDGSIDFTAEDQQLTGAADSTNDYAVWNQYINELYYELCDRYGERIKGLWFDGYGAETGSAANQKRLRETCLSINPGLILTMNTAFLEGNMDPKPGYTCQDYRAWEIDRKVDFANDLKFSRYQSAVVMGSAGWWTKVGKDTTVYCQSAEDMFKYLVAISSVSTHGGLLASTGVYPTRDGEVLDDLLMSGIYAQMHRMNTDYLQPVRESILDTADSTAFRTTENITVADLVWGVANESQDGRYVYLHILNAPQGNTLQLPATADGTVFKSQAQILNFDGTTTAVTLEENENGYYITLPEGVFWHEVDTVIKAERTAATHTHCTCAGAVQHTCGAKNWILWGDQEAERTSLPVNTGSYVLTSDIQVTAESVIIAGQSVELCLNGHSITNTETASRIYNISGKLSICDCSEEPGQIVGSGTANGGTFYVNTQGVLDLYGGIITANATATNGGVLYVVAQGTVTLYGGTITGGNVREYGGNISIFGTMYMYGGVVEKGSTTNYAGNIYNRGILQVSGGQIRDALKGHNLLLTTGSTTTITGGTVCGSVARNIQIWDSGVLYVSGGEVRKGSFSGRGGSIYADKGGKIYITGGIFDDVAVNMIAETPGASNNALNAATLSVRDAHIETLYLADANATYDLYVTVGGQTVIGRVTANSVPVCFDDLCNGASVVYTDAVLDTRFGTGNSTNYIHSENGLIPVAVGTTLKWAQPKVMGVTEGTETPYASLQLAVDSSDYVKLMGDVTEDVVVNEVLYLDLNGNTLTGNVTGDGTLYGMDSATDNYTTENMGRITGTVSCNVEKQFKTDVTGSIRRYMAISDDNGYTFHRFYMGITHINVKPGVTGVGYKAVFCGDEQVQAQIVGYGYTLWVGENGKKMSAGKEGAFTSGQVVTARLQNFDVANYGESAIYGTVYLTLTDGTTIESSTVNYTFRNLVEQIFANADRFTETQLSALRDMLNRFEETTSKWNINGIM